MISSVRLQNFRSYRDQSFEFAPSVNIIVGPNASGKTNLLEAVAVLATGTSARAKDEELIATGKDWARLEGNFDNETRTIKLTKISPAKTTTINGKTYRRLNRALNYPIVYFDPDHLNLITKGPAERRFLIDELLAQSQIEFHSLASAYRRTLTQRNNLLKKPSAQIKTQIFAWNVRLCQLASQIATARGNICEQLNQTLSSNYSKIAGKKTQIHLHYKPMFPVSNYATKMMAQLEKDQLADIARGFTGSGPHREDFSFSVNGQPMAQTASRGEVRSLFLTLKNIELKLLEGGYGKQPILLLDDVFSELDGARRKALVNTLKDYQTIITTTDADSVLDFFGTKDHNLMALSGRRVS